MHIDTIQDWQDFVEWEMQTADLPGYEGLESNVKAVRDLEAWELKLSEAERLADESEDEYHAGAIP